MTKPTPEPSSAKSPKPNLSDEALSRLRAEAKAPYRGLRQFLYLAFAASALIGGWVFCFKVLAGENLSSTIPSLALQVGVFTLMIWLFRWEQRKP